MTHVIRESIDIRFPGRRLGGELAYPGEDDPVFAALVIGPHPYMGGTMQNVLLAAIAVALASAGGVSLRFDYGGTGRSSDSMAIDLAASMAAFWETGHTPEDPERFDDAEAALRYLQLLGVHPLFLVGYSFGAAVAWRLAQNETADIAGVSLVSPTLSRHEFVCANDGRARPTLVIHGQDDFCTPEPIVAEWVRSRRFPIQYSCHSIGNHFFRGAEQRIGREVVEFVASVREQRPELTAC